MSCAAKVTMADMELFDETIKEISKLYMYKNITKPGVLLEVGFISNPGDRYMLKKDDYQDKIASVISNALIRYFNM